MTDISGRVERVFEQNLTRVTELSHTINADPELAFEEHRTSTSIIAALEQTGAFSVETRVAELPTAFTATAGSGDLMFGLCAEMDALPDIGHGCGHNVIAAATVGAALALAPFVDELGLTAGVRDACGGARHGQGDHGQPRRLQRNACGDDGAPFAEGRRHSAVPRLSVLADHLHRPRRARLPAVARTERRRRDGGCADLHRAAAAAAPRRHPGASRDKGSRLGRQCHRRPSRDRVHDPLRHDPRGGRGVGAGPRCFDAGAVATGTSVEVALLPSLYREFRHDRDLAMVFQANAEAIGRTFPDYADKLFGSTDMGNVSQRIPALHPMLSFELPPEDGNHTAAFAVAAGGPEGDRFVRDGGLAMALTIAEVAQSGSIRARLLAGIDIVEPRS